MNKEKPEKKAQEQELWDRIGTTTGADRAQTLDQLSQIVFKRSEWNVCLSLVESSIEIYHGLGKDLYKSELLHAYEGAAHCLRNLERWSEAALIYQEIADFEKDYNFETLLGALRNAACCWYSAEEFEKSLIGHQAVIKQPDPEATDYSIGIDLLNIGMCYTKLKRSEEAIDCYIQARASFKKSKSPTYVNYCDGYLAEEYLLIENGPEAIFHAKHFLNFATVVKDLELEGFAAHYLGKAYFFCGNFEDARNFLTKSITLLTGQDCKTWDDIIDAHHYLAKSLMALGFADEGAETLDRILTIEETIKD